MRFIAVVAVVVVVVVATPAAAQKIVVHDVWDRPSNDTLLLLVNEPAPTPAERARIDEILGWLDSSDDDHADDDHLLAASIRSDLRDFPRAVDRAIAEIAAGAAAVDGVVIVTNRGLQRGVVHGGGQDRPVVERPFVLPPALLADADSQQQSNPLSNRVVVDHVLASFKGFGPGRHVVVTWSHGDHDYALTPRIGLPTAGLTKETFLARVHGEVDVGVTRLGLRTADVVERIEWHLPNAELVVLASCGSQLTTMPKWIKNALVVKDGGSLAYDALDFAKVFARRGESRTLKDAFVTTWTPSPFEHADPERVHARERHKTVARVARLLPWFTPLALWLVVMVVVVVRRRR